MISLARFATLIAMRRAAADWRLQSAAGFGMVLAVALMAATVIYSTALAETALRHTLNGVPDEEVNLSLRAFHALERPTFNSTSGFVDDRVQGSLSAYLQDTTLLVQTSPLYFTDMPGAGQSGPGRPRTSLQAISELAAHTRVVDGRLPISSFGEVEVVIDSLGASALGIEVGQQLHLFSATTEDESRTAAIRIVGIIEPTDRQEPYWQIGPWDRFTSTERQWVALPMYADMDSLLDIIGMAVPGLRSDFIWLFRLDRPGLQVSEVDELRLIVGSVTRDIRSNLPNSSWETGLEEVLERYALLLAVARVPLFLVVFLALGVLLYYLFLIAGLIGRVRAPEVALFRSRGASTAQVGVVILIEGLLMAIPAITVGPLLAQALVSLTGGLFPAGSVDQVLVRIDLSPAVFMLGAVGALLAVAVLTGATLGSSHQGIVAYRSATARPPDKPWLHRYYIDLVLLVLIGIVWWQLKSRGSFLVQPLGGEGAQIDLTLLLGPTMGVVAAGLVLLRLYPIALRLLTRVTEPFSSVWLVHAMRRVARDPIPSGALMVLLALATSLGVLGSAVIATLERSQEEQALYQAGADVRIGFSLGPLSATGRGVAGEVNSLPEVDQAADAMRVETRITTATFGNAVTFMAVDTAALPRVAWTRPDFTGGSLDEALQPLMRSDDSVRGLLLPIDATDLGIWVQAGRLARDATLGARLEDSRGIYFDIVLGEVPTQGWTRLEAPIQPLSYSRRIPAPDVEPPYTLHSLWISSRGRTGGVIFLDQFEAVTPQALVEIESFQNVDGWHPLDDPSAPGLYSLDVSDAVARPGRRSAVFIWAAGGLAQRGIAAGPPQTSVPVLVSRSLIDGLEGVEGTQVDIGDVLSVSVGGVLLPVELIGTIDLFPTLDPSEMPFMVADIDATLEYVSLHTARPVFPSLEVWVSSAAGQSALEPVRQTINSLGGTVREIFNATKLIEATTQDPLLTAGWSGLLSLSFLAVVLATASGLVLYTYIDARERQGEFAVLRSIGFSRLQVNGVVWFNLALTVAVGLGVGTLGGHWLGRAVLPLLEVAEGGTRIIPPMALETDWMAMGVAYLVLAAATAVTVVALAWSISRLDVQRLLRIAE